MDKKNRVVCPKCKYRFTVKEKRENYDSGISAKQLYLNQFHPELTYTITVGEQESLRLKKRISAARKENG